MSCTLSTNTLCRVWVPIAIGSVAVFLRLIWIDQEFVDFWSWRQSDVAMIARNFYENGFKLFWPQIDWSGAGPGYVGTEFPLVPAVAALLYVPLGEHEWIGRGISIFFFAISLPAFFFLVERIYDKRITCLAVALYSAMPLTIFASRSFMPDIASVSCIILATYFLLIWLEEDKLIYLVLFTFFTAVSLLVKITAVIVGVPMVYLCVAFRGQQCLLDYRLLLLATISLGLVVLWYAHAISISTNYPPHHMFGAGGLSFINFDQAQAILKRTSITLTPLALGFAALGVVLSPRSNSKGPYFFTLWLLAGLAFVVLAAHGNRHDWYRLIICPSVAALAALATVYLWDKLEGLQVRLPLAAAVGAAFAWLSYSGVAPLYQSWNVPALRAGQEINRVTPQEALVVAVDGGDPTLLYYARRKGWHFLKHFGSTPQNSNEAIKELESLRDLGADYLVFPEYAKWWLSYYTEFAEQMGKYRVAVSKPEYVIFDLR